MKVSGNGVNVNVNVNENEDLEDLSLPYVGEYFMIPGRVGKY